MVALAHGDLRKRIKNPKLRSLIGVIQTMAIGDAQARLEAEKGLDPTRYKTKAQKLPALIIVELQRSDDEWRIILDAEHAVDSVLEGKAESVEVRTQGLQTEILNLEMAQE